MVVERGARPRKPSEAAGESPASEMHGRTSMYHVLRASRWRSRGYMDVAMIRREFMMMGPDGGALVT